MKHIKLFEGFLNEQKENKQDISVTVILKENDDYKDIIKSVKTYGAYYIPNSYQIQNHLISLVFKIDNDLLSDLITFLENIGVEDIITE